jgi:hypothetical protein
MHGGCQQWKRFPSTWVVSRQSRGQTRRTGQRLAFTRFTPADRTRAVLAQRASASPCMAVANARRSRVVHAIATVTFSVTASTIRGFLWRFGRGVAISSVNLAHAPRPEDQAPDSPIRRSIRCTATTAIIASACHGFGTERARVSPGTRAAPRGQGLRRRLGQRASTNACSCSNHTRSAQPPV